MIKEIDKDKLLKDAKEMSKAIKKKRIGRELYCIGLINKIDAVLDYDIPHYHRIIIVKQLINDYRESKEE